MGVLGGRFPLGVLKNLLITGDIQTKEQTNPRSTVKTPSLKVSRQSPGGRRRDLLQEAGCTCPPLISYLQEGTIRFTSRTKDLGWSFSSSLAVRT